MNEYTNRKCKAGLPSKSSPPSKEKRKISITMGVFFDGTKNNKYNIDHWENIDDSYQGSYTIQNDKEEFYFSILIYRAEK